MSLGVALGAGEVSYSQSSRRLPSGGLMQHGGDLALLAALGALRRLSLFS
jgi:hypothetical protein